MEFFKVLFIEASRVAVGLYGLLFFISIFYLADIAIKRIMAFIVKKFKQ